MARGFHIEDIRPLLDDVDSLHEKVGDPEMLWGNPDKTILAYANAAYQHIHMPGFVWPNDCTVCAPQTAATANTFGVWAELVPTGGITAGFDCHWVTVTNISVTGVYIVEFHLGDDPFTGSQGFLTAFSVARTGTFDQSAQVSVQMPPIPGGSRVAVRAKKSGDPAGIVSFNIHYHTYQL